MKWIVVVEDDLSTLHMMQEILASEGYGILTCANGAALEAAQQRSARVRKERYAAGLCYCRLHFIAGIAKGNGITMHFYEALLQKFESANFRCFYTGVPLVPGINACVVHLYSRSQYPDQIADLENLVWCDLVLFRLFTQAVVVYNKRSNPPCLMRCSL
jgi:CheY-like chemotaxis protein